MGEWISHHFEARPARPAPLKQIAGADEFLGGSNRTRISGEYILAAKL